MHSTEVIFPLTSVTSIMQDYYGSQPSSKWSTDFILRIIHGITQIIVIAAGLTVGLSLGWVTSDFGNCVLHAKMTISQDENDTFIMDRDNTKWESQTYCSYVTYTGVCCSIYAIIWCWFYLLISEWGSRLTATGRPPDLSLLIASIVLGFIFSCCTLAGAVIVTEGLKDWCNSLDKSLKTIFPEKASIHCSDMAQKEWTYPENGRRAYRYTVACEVGIWLLVASFLLQTIIAAFRVKMFSDHYGEHLPKKGEESKRIIEEVDDDDVQSDDSHNETSSSELFSPYSNVTAAVEVYTPGTSNA